MIFFYGLLLEELDMRIFKTYHYSKYFLLEWGLVPVSIAWLWAVILGSSMAISDALGLPPSIRPFADALLAVWMDLSIDAIAIRMGLWKWVIPLNEGWFGVPAGNLYAWMGVVFFYSALARMIRSGLEKNKSWQWAYPGIPFLAYFALFIALNSVGALGRWLGFTTHAERLYLFWGQFLIFLFMVILGLLNRRPTGGNAAAVWWGGRLVIHLYFLTGFFLFGIFQEIPVLGVIAGVVLGGEIVLHQILHRFG